MNKVYTRINWENSPSTNTAISEANLNKMDMAINEIDNRVVKLSKLVDGKTNEIASFTANYKAVRRDTQIKPYTLIEEG